MTLKRSRRTVRQLRHALKPKMATRTSKKRMNGTAPQRNSGRYVLEDQVGFQLRLAVQRHTAIFVARMVLTQTQFATLVKLNEVGPCSQNQLARMVALDAATINGVLDRLRKRGYIAVDPDPDDARQRLITVTTSGRRAVEEAIKAARKITAETLLPLSANERVQLSRLLNKIS